ncbi:hypothetical protein VTK26DRAFT_2750 [Humicola hyalothermophila]
MSREINPLIYSYSHLKHLPKQEEALRLLKMIASIVKPLMRARGWKVYLLSELWNDEKGLLGLNINKGEEIQLRLRASDDVEHFLADEAILDTMLHELAHIVHGPHNEFHTALWHQLRDELEALQMKGFTGQDFLTPGQRLGGQRMPEDEIRRLVRAEAERHRSSVASNGRRLGGTSLRPGEDMRSNILESIERRWARSERGCANSNRSEREILALSRTSRTNGFRTRADEEAANEAAIAQALWELVQEDQKRKAAWRLPPIPSGQTLPTPPATSQARSRPPERHDGQWACRLCTLHNPAHATRCEACSSLRTRSSVEVIDLTDSPQKRKHGDASRGTRYTGMSESTVAARTVPAMWSCSFCSNVMESRWWACSLCGKIKETS